MAKRTAFSCSVTTKPVVPITRSQKTVVEFQGEAGGGGWLVMQQDGRIEFASTPQSAMDLILKAADKGNPGVTITTVEWRDVPVGFIPPGGQ